MRISDWSSDVCSSDLAAFGQPRHGDNPASRPQGRDQGPSSAMTDHDVGVMQQLLHFGERQRVDNLHARDGWRPFCAPANLQHRSEEHTSELQSLMRISYAVFCLKKKKKTNTRENNKTKYQQ